MGAHNENGLRGGNAKRQLSKPEMTSVVSPSPPDKIVSELSIIA